MLNNLLSPPAGAIAETIETSAHGLTKEVALRFENCTLTYRGIPVRDMLAFPTEIAARMIGISGTTLRREIARGKLKRTSLKLISRNELIRYLDADADLIDTPRQE
jgi:hypothetical protein